MLGAHQINFWSQYAALLEASALPGHLRPLASLADWRLPFSRNIMGFNAGLHIKMTWVEMLRPLQT